MLTRADSQADNELMRRTAEGDSHAFRLLLTRHLPKSHAIARRVLRSEQDAEETVQDAFNKVWVHAASFDPAKAMFSTWFYRILVNACHDRMRRREPAHASLDESEEFLPDSAASQEAKLAAAQESTTVRHAVQSLPENQRMAVVLCYFEEMTNPQAAALMGLHLKALEGLLVRARKSLRDMLAENYREAV